MSDWTAGYVADIGYTFGYYTELNPLRLRLAFLNAGLALPQTGTACELGFGQGLSANVHAVASQTQWFGTDFNPAQAAFAQELAHATGSGAKLYDDAFSEFCARPDLPDFDYIGLHGIWSWISDENRSIIVDFVRRKLKVGGVLYISYNTMPGWAAFAPMRHLLTEHAQTQGAEGHGIVSRIDSALGFAEKLLATKPGFSTANPQVEDRLKQLTSQNRHYLAHEYFNRDWHPMHFATMADWLATAKVSFACSANLLDHIDELNFSSEQNAFLKEISDPMFRESVRDFVVNQQFRRDYWVKGARSLSPLERVEAIREQRIVLTAHRADVSLKVSGAREATMNAEVYQPILDLLADHKIRTIEEVEKSVREKNINFLQVAQAVIALIGAGHVAPAQDDVAIAGAKADCDKLNAFVIKRARSSGDIGFLASPVTGGAIAVGRFAQLFMLAAANGRARPEEWAEFAWQLMNSQTQRLLKDGRVLQTVEENLAELTEQAKDFETKTAPILKALLIA